MYQVIIISLLINTWMAAPTEDLVTYETFRKFNIPYAGKMYSGYLPIEEDTKAFHYFFFPAYDLAGLQATIPLILWLNGGPGCSSLYGALNENGPFVFNLGTNEMRKNEWSWTNFAHMFYLESPGGVGYSYGNLESGDTETAKDNLIAVIEFFKKFPEYKGVDFYLAGESYAGIYIPTLASEIIDYNAKQASAEQINLRGLLIGNGCTDPSECTNEGAKYRYHVFDFAHNHNLISEELWEEIVTHKEECMFQEKQICMEITDKVKEQAYGSQEFYFNMYNIYGKCYTLPTTKFNGEVIPTYKTQGFDPAERPLGRVAECSEAQGLYYLFTNPEFRAAINVNDKSPEWTDCNGYVNMNFKRDPRGSYYLYPKLMSNGIRILSFSGDVDAVVPITGTLYWIEKLQNEFHIPTLENWRPWFLNGERKGEDQNAGNVMVIDGLWFVSVRNAGHMVPMDQPQAASVMASYFIYNIPLPYVVP